MSTFARPFRRVTTTPRVRRMALTQLLEFVSSFTCRAHNHHAAVQEVLDGQITYAACCEDLIDLIERALRQLPDPVWFDPSLERGPRPLR